jgi:heme exporter protein D
MSNLGLYRKVAPMSSKNCQCQALPAQPGITPWIIRLMFVLLLMALVLASPVRAQDAGVLEGQVVNGTQGGSGIGAGIPVNLYLFDASTDEQILTTETDADGYFRFEGLDTTPALEYWVEAIYRGVAYGSADLLQFGEGQTTLETTVTVYETAEDDTGVRLDLVHIFAESFGEVLRISETHLFGSTEDRTYIGEQNAEGQAETVFIPVPANVVGFALGDGIAEDRFTTVNGGLIDSDPVRPGTLMSEVRFSYHLMATDNPIVFERSFAYPVTNLTVLVAQPGLLLTSEQLESMGTQLIQDRQYEIFTGQNIAPDAPVVFEFTSVETAEGSIETGGMPSDAAMSSGSAVGDQGLLLWFGVGLALVAVAGVVVYAVTSRRPASRQVVSDPGPTYDPKARQMIARLADLEDEYEAGEIDEDMYVIKRMQIFKELGSS